MRLKLFGLLAISSAMLPTCMLAQGNSQGNGNNDNDKAPFVLNGVSWANKQAFIDAARCNTKRLNDEEVDEIDAHLKQTLRGKGRNPDTSLRSANGSIFVNVYFHVITDSSGSGFVPVAQMNQQIAVLNAAFTNTPFRFSLAQYNVTSNNTWFTASPGSTAEKNMKSTLRQGSADDLNIYMTNPGGGLLEIGRASCRER